MPPPQRCVTALRAVTWFRPVFLLWLLVAGAAPCIAQETHCNPAPDGSNPCPVTLLRPPSVPLSAMARLGKSLFFDTGLSGSGRLSCASCHVPGAHYAPDTAVVFAQGGRAMDRHGGRAVPSLTYRERQPPFSIGPDNATSETPAPSAPDPNPRQRAGKSADQTGTSALAMVPQGGLFWDGRADTLQTQAEGPLFDPDEMAATRPEVIARLKTAPYSADLRRLAGPGASDTMLVAEALFALARYQIEAPDFHPYSSRFDAWLEGRTRLTREEADGYMLFNDPAKGNCAACHLSAVDADGRPPLFTDHQYEALAAPRQKLAAAGRFDLGLCAAGRQDIGPVTAYCGFFRTPSLRNSATRRVFFHNGAFSTLRQVMDFYVLRDITPEKFYPRRPDGTVALYNDLPDRYWSNIDKSDAPFGARKAPALTPAERDKIVSFLQTLTDRPRTPPSAPPG